MFMAIAAPPRLLFLSGAARQNNRNPGVRLAAAPLKNKMGAKKMLAISLAPLRGLGAFRKRSWCRVSVNLLEILGPRCA